ncbi:MAG: hypothetical protein ACO29V_14210, partial [Limnohabitans sp.]
QFSISFMQDFPETGLTTPGQRAQRVAHTIYRACPHETLFDDARGAGPLRPIDYHSGHVC